VTVLFYVIDDIKGPLRFDIAGLRTLAKGNAVHHSAALRINQLKFDVLLVASDDLAGSVVIHLLCAEEWLIVVRPVGGKSLEVRDDSAIDVPEVDKGVDAQYGVDLLWLNVLLHIVFEAVSELRDILCGQTEACCICVASEVFEQVGTAFYCLIDVEPRYASCRAGGHAVFITSEDDAWLVEDFGQTGCHDADDAAVPFLVEQDDGLVLVSVLKCFDDAIGLFRHGFVEVFALFVVLIDLLCEFFSRIGVSLDEQCDGFVASLHSARRIDAWSYLEYDVAQRYLFVGESAYLHEGFHSCAW